MMRENPYFFHHSLMAKYISKHNKKIHLIILGVFVCTASFLFFYPRSVSKANELNETYTQKTKPKYSEFSHSIQQHKLACDSCHKFPTANWKKVRKPDEAFPDVTDYPQHSSCLNCHRQQFFKGAKPTICSICHINPSPRDSSRYAFPNPREIFDSTEKGKQAVTDFDIFFPHDKHIDIISKINTVFEEKQSEGKAVFLSHGSNKTKILFEEESCSVCHKTYKPQNDSDDEYVTKPPAKLGDTFWLKKGTFKTSPISHAQCFTCHSEDTGINPLPGSCATCHKIKQENLKTDFDAKLGDTMGITDKIILAVWRARESSATFRHEWFSHSELSCATCHNVMAMNTTDIKTKKVKVLSCGGEGCHVTPTSDDGGILNIEIDLRKTNSNYMCAKCHISYGKSAIPESHIKAVATLAGK